MLRRGSPNSRSSAPLAVSRLLRRCEGLVSWAVGHTLAALVSEESVPSARSRWKSRFVFIVVTAVGRRVGIAVE